MTNYFCLSRSYTDRFISTKGRFPLKDQKSCYQRKSTTVPFNSYRFSSSQISSNYVKSKVLARKSYIEHFSRNCQSAKNPLYATGAIWIFHNPQNGNRRERGFAKNRVVLAFPLCAVVSCPNISSLKLVLDSNAKNKALENCPAHDRNFPA